MTLKGARKILAYNEIQMSCRAHRNGLNGYIFCRIWSSYSNIIIKFLFEQHHPLYSARRITNTIMWIQEPSMLPELGMDQAMSYPMSIGI